MTSCRDIITLFYVFPVDVGLIYLALWHFLRSGGLYAALGFLMDSKLQPVLSSTRLAFKGIDGSRNAGTPIRAEDPKPGEPVVIKLRD